jgi:carboxyl-terminal processing protease
MLFRMMKSNMKAGIAILFLVGIAGSYAVGFSAGKAEGKRIPIEGVFNLGMGQPDDVDFSLFWEAWLAVQEKYARYDEVHYDKLVQGAISGMVRSLGDPYSIFLSAEDTSTFLDDLSGYFEGVGMEIGMRKGELTVISPLDGTPAKRAGIRPGDKILKIADTLTNDLTLDEAVSLIRGPRGTTVVLTIFREGKDGPLEIGVERDVIEIPTLSWELKEGDVAYVKLSHFSEKARSDFRGIAKEISRSTADRIILDMRNNPGGFLEVAVDIGGWFVPSGSTIVIEDFRNIQDQKVYTAKGSGVFADLPVVVLINEGSASASEILAGALRDVLNAQLVGMKSFGKGSVQELEKLSNESSLKITVANWLTPNGNLIEGAGLVPDTEVDLSLEDLDAGNDPQLDKALEIIQDL